MQYGDMESGNGMLLDSSHQAITWTSGHLSSMGFCGTHISKTNLTGSAQDINL